MPGPMRTRYLLGFASATAILLLVGLSIVAATQRFRTDGLWVAHSHDVIHRLDAIEIDLVEGLLAQRNYLLSGNAVFRDDYAKARTRIRAEVASVAALTVDNAAQAGKVTALGAQIEQRLDSSDEGIRIFQQQGIGAVQAYVRNNRSYALSREVHATLGDIQDTEQGLLRERIRASETSADILLALGLLGIPLSLLIVWTIYRMLSREVRERLRAQVSADILNEHLNANVAKLERASADLTELRRYSGLLQGCRNVPEALDTTRRALAKLLPDCAGTIYLLRASADHAEAESGWGEHVVPSHALLAPQECWALRRGQPHCVDDIHRDPTCSHMDLPPADVEAVTACIPLNAQSINLGFLYLSAPGKRPMPRIEIAIAAAEQLSLALGNLHLQDTLRQQSIRDALTGLFNRRYLEESLPRELARAERRQLPLALLMLDLDHFKAFNDAHGHDGGDALLAAFGRLLQAHCRSEDIPCRYGGEEFVMILPEIDVKDAMACAERIRASVNEMVVPHLQRNLSGTTVSIGLAMYPHEGSTAEQLRRVADAALYRAKRHGRNRIEVAEPA